MKGSNINYDYYNSKYNKHSRGRSTSPLVSQNYSISKLNNKKGAAYIQPQMLPEKNHRRSLTPAIIQKKGIIKRETTPDQDVRNYIKMKNTQGGILGDSTNKSHFLYTSTNDSQMNFTFASKNASNNTSATTQSKYIQEKPSKRSKSTDYFVDKYKQNELLNKTYVDISKKPIKKEKSKPKPVLSAIDPKAQSDYLYGTNFTFDKRDDSFLATKPKHKPSQTYTEFNSKHANIKFLKEQDTKVKLNLGNSLINNSKKESVVKELRPPSIKEDLNLFVKSQEKHSLESNGIYTSVDNNKLTDGNSRFNSTNFNPLGSNIFNNASLNSNITKSYQTDDSIMNMKIQSKEDRDSIEDSYVMMVELIQSTKRKERLNTITQDHNILGISKNGSVIFVEEKAFD